MGVVRLCWCLWAILLLPSLDARSVKLVPTETKTITTNGATHEISRYILVPDDESSGTHANSITNDEIPVQTITSTVENATNNINNTKGHRTVSTKVKYKTIIPEDLKTPDSVKYHVVYGANHDDDIQTDYKANAKVLENLLNLKNGNAKGSMEHTKVTYKENNIPRKDSTTTVIWNHENNDAGDHSNLKSGASKSYYEQSTHTVTKGVSDLNGQSSKTETGSGKTAGDSNNSRRIIVNNPSKITNIKYTDLPIKWGNTQSDGKGEDHTLLLGINKTFTLPGKRGRFKIIYEDDDEYDNLHTVLHKPNLGQSTSNSARQTITHYYNNKYFVDNTKTTNDDEDKNENSYRILMTKNNGHDTVKKNDFNKNTEIEKGDDIPLKSSYEIKKSNSRYTNVGITKSHTDVLTDNIEGTHTYSDNTNPIMNYKTGQSKLVKNTNEEPTDSNVGKIYVQNSVIVPTLNKTSSFKSKSDIETVEPRIKNYEFSSRVQTIIEDNIPSNKTYFNEIPSNFATNNRNTFGVEAVHENSKTVAQISNKNDNETIEPTQNTSNKQTTIFSQKNANYLKVLPLKDDMVDKYSSQTEKIKTVNATNTKTSVLTDNTFGIPSTDNSIIEITSLNNQSKVTTPKNYMHTIDIAPIINKNSSKTAIITKFENKDLEKVATPLNSNKTTETVGEIEIPKADRITKLSVLENENTVTTPKINIQDIVTSSQKQNIQKNKNMISNQKSQKVPSLDINNSGVVVDPIHSSVNVLNFLGTKNSYEVVANEDTQAETVAKVHQIKDLNKSSVSENYNKITVPNRNNQIIAKTNDSVRNDLRTIIDNKDKQVDTNTKQFLRMNNSESAITAKSNIDSIPKLDFVDYEIESAAKNKKNKQLKEIELTEEINNIGRIEYTDSSTDTLPKTHIKTERLQLTPDETKQSIHEDDEISENTKPTLQINNVTPESNNLDLKFRLGMPAAKFLLGKSKFTLSQGKYENSTNFEQFYVSKPNKITSADDNDSNPSKYPYEGDNARSIQISYGEGLTDTAASEDINNQYVNEHSNNIIQNGAYQYHVAGNNYPVPTISYVPAYPYQAKDCTQVNDANSENVIRIRYDEVIDDEYLQYILNYMLSKNVMLKLKGKYAVAGHGVDANAIRATHVVEHLQNLGIYNRLSQVQLHFLIQQLQKYETINQKNENHKIVILPDKDDQRTPLNRIYVPNHYVLYTQNVVPTNEIKLLRNEVYLQRYLLSDFDVNTVNNAVGDLVTRVVNLVTYLRNLRVPNAMIMQFIADAKKLLTTEVLQSFAAECPKRFYDNLGQRIDMIAKQVLQKCTQTTQYQLHYVFPHGY